tara:strand:+ start:110 stop:1237 length:1128 start_codon:yes stop_codon:yes gene_type:complete
MEKSYHDQNLKYFYIFLCVLGCFIPTLTLQFLFELPLERILLKSIGTSIFLVGIFLLMTVKGLNLKNLMASFVMTSFFYIFAFSSFLYDSSESLNHLLRACLATLICYFFLEASKNDLKIILNIVFVLLFLIALIGVLSILLNFSNGEKFPILNIASTKSIVFEQNVYGIATFFLLFICTRYKQIKYLKSIKYLVTLIGIMALLFSFYRTVYLCLMALLFINSSRKVFWLIFFSTLLFLYLIYFNNLELISEIFKLEQISNLTGRVEMYILGWELFLENPIIGLSELSIPYYLQFTTFHNLFLDTLIFGGIIGLVLLIMSYMLLLQRLDIKHYTPLLLMLLPSLLNTFYIFGPNILGFSAAALIFSHQIEKENWK